MADDIAPTPDEFEAALMELLGSFEQERALNNVGAAPKKSPGYRQTAEGLEIDIPRPDSRQMPLGEPVVAPWLTNQLADVKDGTGQRFPSGVFEPFTGAAALGAELTGVPSIMRGVGHLRDEDGDALTKLQGASEVSMGAVPGLSITRAAAPAVNALAGTIPRYMATSAPAFLADPLRTLIPSAYGAEPASQGVDDPQPQSPVKYEGPPRSRLETKQIQERLRKSGDYAGSVDEVDKAGTRDAEYAAAMRQYKQDLEAWRARKLQRDTLELQREQLKAQGKASDAATARTEEERRARDAAENRKSEADKARTKVTEGESPYAQLARTVGPWLGIIPGMLLGNKLAKWSGEKLTAGAEKGMVEANALLKGDPKFADKLGSLNQFWARGQPANPENLFLRDDKARKAPFWKPNPAAPQSSELYPASKGREYALGAALPTALGGIEMLTGGLGGWYYGNQAEDATNALNDPAATAADVLAAAARRDAAENKAAIAEGLMRVGMGTAGYGVPKSAFDTFMRPSMRPNTAKADAWRNDVSEAIAKTRAKEAAKAATKKAGQQAGTAAKPAGKSPNGLSGGALLAPPAAGSLLPGEQPREGPFPRGSNASDDLPAGHSLTDRGQIRRPDGTYGPMYEP